jgi:hypothetical protein
VNHRWAKVIISGAVILAVLVFFAWVTGPPTPHEYRTDAQKAASGSLSAVRTTVLAGRAELAGNLVGLYLTATLDDAADGARTTQSNLAGQSPPDGASRSLRDQVAPMLAQAVAGIGDVSVAVDSGDDAALSAALDRLSALGDKLDAFLTSSQ